MSSRLRSASAASRTVANGIALRSAAGQQVVLDVIRNNGVRLLAGSGHVGYFGTSRSPVGASPAGGICCGARRPLLVGRTRRRGLLDACRGLDGDCGAGVWGDTLRYVRERGYILVGVNDALPGFGFIRPDGTFAGFDVEFGHALAAAIFGDRDAVQFVGVSSASRFEALRYAWSGVALRATDRRYVPRPPEVRQ